jgi:hypothetical protein
MKWMISGEGAECSGMLALWGDSQAGRVCLGEEKLLMLVVVEVDMKGRSMFRVFFLVSRWAVLEKDKD